MRAEKCDFERKEALQAVIIGESFDNLFDPITKETPKLLLPLVNTPIVDYLMDWLHRCEVEEVFLYCRSTPFSASIKKHCRSLSERRQWSNMKVRVIASDDIRSTGDAMRDLYAKSLIMGDFILLRGDTVGSIDLRSMVNVHKAHRQRDPKTALTCILMANEQPDNEPDCLAERLLEPDRFTSTSSQRLPDDSDDNDSLSGPHGRGVEEGGVGGSGSGGNLFSCSRVSTITDIKCKILSYNRHRLGTSSSFPVYLSYMLPTASVSVQLADPGITICSSDLPGLFTDNFDCMTLDSLVKGLVQPDDLNECSVYQYVARHGYASCLNTWCDYERVSLVLLQRLLSPITPEVSLTSGRRRYQLDAFNHHYWAASSNVGYNCFRDDKDLRKLKHRLGIKVLCGEGIEVAPSCELHSCVFGNMCRVGDNVKLNKVFVGNNCVIESNCSAELCYLGNNVTLLANTKLAAGCVVSSGVTLGPDVQVPAGSLLCTKQLWDGMDDFDKEDDEQCELVSGTGYSYPRSAAGGDGRRERQEDDDDDDDDEEQRSPGRGKRERKKSSGAEQPSEALVGLVLNQDGQTLPVWGLRQDDSVPLQPELDDDSESGEEGDQVDGGAKAWEDDLDEDEQKELEFVREVMDSLSNGIRERTDAAKVALEINASRYAYNITLETMQEIVFKGVLRSYEEEQTGEEYSEKSSWPAWPIVKKGLHRYSEVLQRYLKTDADFLSTFERMVCNDDRVLSSAVKLLYELTQEMELIDDKALLDWFNSGGGRGVKGGRRSPVAGDSTEGFLKLKEKVADFLSWLQNAEEETSSEEDDDE